MKTEQLGQTLSNDAKKYQFNGDGANMNSWGLAFKQDQEADTTEILETESAQNILPYLTLDRLSQQDTADLLGLANCAIDLMRNDELPRNKFATMEMIKNSIRNAIIGEENPPKDTDKEKLAQAYKVFCASLFNAGNDPDNPNAKWDIYNSFFGMSPNVASYCGGLNGSLELLMIADRTNQNPCTREIYGDIVYNYAFTPINGFKEIFEKSDSIRQLRLLPIFNNIAMSCNTDDYTSRTLDKVLGLLSDASDNPETKPLVKLAAESIGNNLAGWFNGEWVDIDESIPEHAMIVANHKKKMEAWQRKQELLHQNFPALPADQDLTRIAPGIGATVSGGVINILSDNKGRTTSLLNYSKDNSFGLDRDIAFLMGAAHNPDIKELIDKKLGIDLSDVPLEAQKHFLRFMTESENERFSKLCDTMSGLDKKSRLKLLENFVAVDFGEDFGDALLDIANSDKISQEQLGAILDNVDSCRKSISEIAGLYGDFDGGKFGKEYARAANERLTDALMVFREIGKSGVAGADLGWFGKVSLDYDKAMEALNYEARSLEIISGTVNAVKNGESGAYAEKVLTSDLYHNRTLYNLYSPGHGCVLLYTRPEGAHNFEPMLEYGKFRSRYSETSNNGGVEASISFIVNPVNPHSLPSPFRPDYDRMKNPAYYNPDTMDKVSAIRIDREGRTPGAPADDPNRDPINELGTVSVDLAAINDRADTPSGKIARLFSLGNKIRSESDDSSLNHNTKWFDQDKYGTASGFKELVNYVDNKMNEFCQKCTPDKDAGFTGLKRQASRRRGKMVTKVA